MKNGKHYYDLLADAEKVLFDKNTTHYGRNKSFKMTYVNFGNYVSSNFIWDGSNEGWGFWNDIATSNRD